MLPFKYLSLAKVHQTRKQRFESKIVLVIFGVKLIRTAANKFFSFLVLFFCFVFFLLFLSLSTVFNFGDIFSFQNGIQLGTVDWKLAVDHTG